MSRPHATVTPWRPTQQRDTLAPDPRGSVAKPAVAVRKAISAGGGAGAGHYLLGARAVIKAWTRWKANPAFGVSKRAARRGERIGERLSVWPGSPSTTTEARRCRFAEGRLSTPPVEESTRNAGRLPP